MNNMKKAHEMTKKIKKEYPEVDYKFQLGLCLAFLAKNEGVDNMIELQGSEKQVKWANEIRIQVLDKLQETKNEYELMIQQAEEKGEKVFKRHLKNVAALEKLIVEVSENASAKAFIEDYRNSILSFEIWEVAEFARNREALRV